ncbi:HAL protein kinase [Pseudogymnoascus sp. 23342-1-I1]|nr:HAL protein kinase [Pseudogymnoascus sp. 23342-1-I1]
MSSVQVVRMPRTENLPSSTPNDIPSKHRSPLFQIGCTPPATSREQSPDSRPIDLQSPIPEEEEDETGSEAANEPLTPTDTQPPHDFRHTPPDDLKYEGSQEAFSNVGKPPLLVNTAATPPPKSSSDRNREQRASVDHESLYASPQRPTSAVDSGIKRGLSQFFRRSNSHSQYPAAASGTAPLEDPSPNQSRGGSDTMLFQRNSGARRASVVESSNTTRSNTPPSPSSTPQDKKTTMLEPDASQFLGKKSRASSGIGFRQRFITFAGPKDLKEPPPRPRATSVDLRSNTQSSKLKEPELTRHEWGFPAEAGTGLKARRMSLSLPDDFWVDVVDLHKEFSDQSKLIGRRGKTLGKGATSKVTLMTRKGGSELHAVKEFRGKRTGEVEEDYEKKVKSEFSIAKSLHHPNIVESIRLCTHNGRWNHVMEYCQEGDLFSLVQKHYLTGPDRLNDRLCIFKQLVQGVNYLHEHGIAHRDIKLENLLVTSSSKIKITDFGVSEVFSGIHPGLREAGGQCGKEMGDVRLCAPGICGSMPYIAPEVVVKNGEYDPRGLDVWSSGIVMLHIIFGGALWPRAERGNRHYDSLVRGWEKWEAKHPPGATITELDYPHVVAFDQMVNPPALRRMLIAMLHPDPAKRIKMADVARNRWLRNIECCQVDTYEDPSTVIDASKASSSGYAGNNRARVVQHNHLPPTNHTGHRFVRLPGSTAM